MEPIISNNPLSIDSLAISSKHCLLVLAPHPDDFDAIGATMRFFQTNGNRLYVAVATSGARGVEDTFCSPATLEAKTKIREQEQEASLQFFGLPKTHLTFLRLEEDAGGHLLENEANIHTLGRYLLSKRPVMVFLPHWQDTNRTHQQVYAMFRQVALVAGYPVATFLNRDPKTIKMRCDFYFGYGQDTAVWKAKLLRFHQSQHQRNLNRRGHGMDDRILRVDRHSAAACAAGAPYAEIFELELFGTKNLNDILN